MQQTISVPASVGMRDNIVKAMEELAVRRDANAIHFAVALYAASDRGKTQTLAMLIEKLKAAASSILEEKASGRSAADKLFCCKYKVWTVGVATGGDDHDAIEEAFTFFTRYNCDIVFCATRSRSDSQSWQKFYAETYARNVRVICVKKEEAAEPDIAAVNDRQADQLLELIWQC